MTHPDAEAAHEADQDESRAEFEKAATAIEGSIRLGIMAEDGWEHGPNIKPGQLTDAQISWLASWLAGDGIGRMT